MEIGGKALAAIVAVMLIGTTLVSFAAYSSFQDDRVVYLTVKTDKKVFGSNEDVTFQLASLRNDYVFDLVDRYDESDGVPYGGIDIWKLSDLTDLETFFDDQLIMEELRVRAEFYPYTAKIHFDHFSSEDGPLHLSWNGTVAVDECTESGHRFIYYPATSGYYIIVPCQTMDFADDDYVFIIDEKAIFYYDSLDANIDAVNHPDDNVTYDLRMRAPPGTVGEITCDLYATLDYPGDPLKFGDEVKMYWNETGVTLSTDFDTVRTLVFDISLPDQGYPNPIEPSWPAVRSTVYFDAFLTTSNGEYHFGFWGEWEGGWINVMQY